MEPCVKHTKTQLQQAKDMVDIPVIAPYTAIVASMIPIIKNFLSKTVNVSEDKTTSQLAIYS